MRRRHMSKHERTEFTANTKSFDEQSVKPEELSPESQEVVQCMREQIKIGGYPSSDVVEKTTEILLEVLREDGTV